MNDRVRIDTDVLEEDAQAVWQEASRVLSVEMRDIPELSTAAFGCVQGMESASGMYRSTREELQIYLDKGSQEFLRFKELLLRTVLAYKEQHGATQDEMDRLMRGLPE